MKRKLIIFSLFMLLSLPLLFSQQTNITATVIDPSSTVWTNGTYNVNFRPTPGVPGPYTWSGGSYQTQYSNLPINSSGQLSITLPKNTAITPSGSLWEFNICPNATFQCVTLNIQATGASLDITSQITSAIASAGNLKVKGLNVPKAYNTAEISPGPQNQGNSYYDTTDGCYKIYDGATWNCILTANIITNYVAKNPTNTQIVTQPVGTTLFVNNLNTVVYYNASSFSTAQDAVAYACNGTNYGSVVFPVGVTVITTALSIPTNCAVSGSGPTTILQSSDTLNSSVININDANNVVLKNLRIDGNRQINTNVNNCITLVNDSNITFDNVTQSNCNNHGTLIVAGFTNILFTGGEIFNTGPVQPQLQGTSAISVYSTLSGSKLIIENMKIHDNSTGILITNTGIVGNDITDITIANNFIYSNANDSILLTTTNTAGGNIIRGIVTDNQISCNGWAPNGIGFPSACTPGFSQSGALASQGGVGVDLIQQGISRVLDTTIANNIMTYNLFEGVASTTTNAPVINTSGTTGTWVSGPKFENNYLMPGMNIIVNGITYTLATIPSDTIFTTTSSMGVQTGVSTNFPAYMGGSITGNIVSFSGYATVGPGFYNQFSDGIRYANNTSRANNLSGYENYFGNYLSYANDIAINNNQVSGGGGQPYGFYNVNGYATNYTGIVAQDSQSVPTQTTGVFIDSLAIRTSIQSQALKAITPINDTSLNANQNYLNQHYVNRNGLEQVNASNGNIAFKVGLTDQDTLFYMGFGPTVIAPGQVGYSFYTQDSVGGNKIPLKFDNQGAIINPISAGTGTALACFDSSGKLFRGSAATCP